MTALGFKSQETIKFESLHRELIYLVKSIKRVTFP